MSTYILALDQGTTSSRAILFDAAGQIVASAGQELPQIYPQAGWVEHDPNAIWQTQLDSVREVLHTAEVAPERIAAIGITNQRETSLAWQRSTGEPLGNAIVWQCRRTAARCQELAAQGLADEIRKKTGLVLDAYFSGPKFEWLLQNVPRARELAALGDLCLGTVDAWLIAKLTGHAQHVTDPTNVSRTMLYDIHTHDWDAGLLALFGIAREALPQVVPSSGVAGHTDPALFGAAVPIAGIAGDQQAALFGQTCWQPGHAKNTYGTGCFLLSHTGGQAKPSDSGLLTTVAASADGPAYALEGSVFVAGAAVQWLRDKLDVIATASASEELARQVPDSGGVVVVPAFTGLGTPYWDPQARGTILGLTLGSTKAHVIRATLEAIAFQTRDVVETMQQESGVALQELRADGGAVANALLMQTQADLLGIPGRRAHGNGDHGAGRGVLGGSRCGFLAERRNDSGAVAGRPALRTPNQRRRARIPLCHLATGCRARPRVGHCVNDRCKQVTPRAVITMKIA